MRISHLPGGIQSATVLPGRRRVLLGTDDGGEVIILNAPVSKGRHARISKTGGYRFFAGWRSEPFFFDTIGAVNDLKFTGSDFFLQKNVCSIVLEVPNSALGLDEWAFGPDADQAERCPGCRLNAARPQQAVSSAR